MIAAAKIIRGFDRRTLAEVPIALLIVNYSVDMLYQHFHGGSRKTRPICWSSMRRAGSSITPIAN